MVPSPGEESRMLRVVRGLPDVLKASTRMCAVCGPVMYVALTEAGSGDHWQTMWSLDSLSESEAENVLEDVLRASLSPVATVPPIRVVPGEAISPAGEVNPESVCHGPSPVSGAEGSPPRHLDKVKRVWKSVLGVTGEIADDDDFFDLGGNSLHAARVAARISRELGFPVPLELLTRHTAASDLARALERAPGAGNLAGDGHSIGARDALMCTSDRRRLVACGETITITELAARELPDALADADWDVAPAIAPARIRAPRGMSRWTASFLVASLGSTVTGLLPVLRHTGAEFGSTVLDPALAAPRIFGSAAEIRADRYLLIGGGTDLVAGVATAKGLAPSTAESIAMVLVDEAFAAAGEQGLTGAALYIRDGDLPLFLGAARNREVERIGVSTSLYLPPGGMESYLRSLSRDRRSSVRRDFRRIEELGLSARELPASSLIDEAAELIAAVKRRHKVADHPLLIRQRLDDWARAPGGECVAFSVRDPTGGLVGASFACRYPSVLELYEVGLADDVPHRHLAYLEALIYAPIRFALRTNCREIDLGLGSTAPKTFRGGTASAVWAVGSRPPR
jgi:acyl carrier protein